MSPGELGRAWHEGRDRITGPELAALLWQVARRAGPGVREIEDEIVAACPLPRLLSAPQRALQLVHGPAPGAPRCATTGHAAPRSAGPTVRR